MKKIIGISLVLLGLLFFTLLILRIWGISIMSWPTVLRSGATFVSVGGLTLFLALVYFLFLKKSNKRQSTR